MVMNLCPGVGLTPSGGPFCFPPWTHVGSPVSLEGISTPAADELVSPA